MLKTFPGCQDMFCRSRISMTARCGKMRHPVTQSRHCCSPQSLLLQAKCHCLPLVPTRARARGRRRGPRGRRPAPRRARPRRARAPAPAARPRGGPGLAALARRGVGDSELRGRAGGRRRSRVFSLLSLEVTPRCFGLIVHSSVWSRH